MSTKKSAPPKKITSKPPIKKAEGPAKLQGARQKMARPFAIVASHTRDLLSRRPHRSFRRTRRRDYTRTLKLPGYWSFTNGVRVMLWQHKVLFGLLAVIYAALTVFLVGMAAQDTYTQLSDVLRNTSGDIFKGNWGAVGQAGLLLATGVTGNFSMSMSESQQMYAVIIGLFTWFTTVWLLRAILAGHKPKLRDGLYNAGAPILPTFLVALLLIVQLLPIVVVILGFTALVPFGILDGGVESMLFWAAALLLIGLSLYWVTSTLVALVIVTLPGMYPLQAVRTAGDLVIGRRLRILLRLLWLMFIVALVWIIIVVPIILLDTWIKGVLPAIAWLPTIPVVLLVMGTLTIIWMASYIYLLYRRIVDDDAAPA